MLYSYIQLDKDGGNNPIKYAIQSDSYLRDWTRAFTSQLSASNIMRLNFVDRGPGIRKYTMTLILETWDTNSVPYKLGITQTVDQQLASLEASYAKVSTQLYFIDPLGNPPALSTGVYFTNYRQIIPKYATNGKVIIQAEIELQEAAGITI
jgi:hypothetical protein